MVSGAAAGPSRSPSRIVGKPCLFCDYFAEWRSFPAVLLDSEGRLSCGGNLLNLGGATQAPAAAGPPVVTATRRDQKAGPQCHFTYRGSGGAIHDLWFDRFREKDRWHAEQLNAGGHTWAPAAAGDPSGAEAEGVFHVTYRDPDGGVQDLWNEGGWRNRRLNMDDATGAPPAAGEPAQLVLPGERHVVYRDAAGGLQDLCFDGAWRASRVVPADGSGAPQAAGDMALARAGRVLHLAYRGRDGGIQHLWHDQAWHRQRLNAGGSAEPGATAAPAAAGEPCLRVADGGRLRVTYRDSGGTLQDLRFDGGWRVQRLNNGGLTPAPPAASDPAALVPPSNWEFIAYVDVAGNAQLLSHFLDNPWQAAWLNNPERRYGNPFPPVTARERLPASGPRN
jgi:hypothetical protein